LDDSEYCYLCEQVNKGVKKPTLDGFEKWQEENE
jgi:hypothetical protein